MAEVLVWVQSEMIILETAIHAYHQEFRTDMEEIGVSILSKDWICGDEIGIGHGIFGNGTGIGMGSANRNFDGYFGNDKNGAGDADGKLHCMRVHYVTNGNYANYSVNGKGYGRDGNNIF
jgi:hypothetical protein